MTRRDGAIFSDVDEQDGDDAKHEDVSRGNDRGGPSATMSFYDAHGRLLYVADVPASRGDASLSFVGVRFEDARITLVRITAKAGLGGATPAAFERPSSKPGT